MSDLHKKVLASRVAGGLPPRAPAGLAAAGLHSPPVGVPQPRSAALRSQQARNKKDYSVIPWTNYFDRMEEVHTEAAAADSDQNRFRVYVKGDAGPVFFFLHGGGFSGLSWALLADELCKQIECQCYCMDIRGHGGSATTDDSDLSITTMANDVKQVIEALWSKGEGSSLPPPPIVLVGHSMGGALAVHTAHLNCVPNLIGLVVIDVVEGSALDALSSMQTFLQGRPKTFNSIEQAIEYNVRSGAIKNVESARVSMVGQLKKVADSSQQQSAIEQVKPSEGNKSVATTGSQSFQVMQTELAEEDEEKEEGQDETKKEEDSFKIPQATAPTVIANEKYEWRIDLSRTDRFWRDWFKGLSGIFLSVNVPKLLLLAGMDRLDKELMVGQMQGKFQMQVLPFCGHAVHEDSPSHVANALASFMIRHKFAKSLTDIEPPKLSC